MHETSKRSLPPGTLLQENRGRGTARRDTWNTFTGKPWQVDGRKSYLERFRGNSVPGGRREVTPGTLSREYRARWKAGRCHLEHSRRKTVPGGRQEETPGTLSQEFRARWTAGKATWKHQTRKAILYNRNKGKCYHSNLFQKSGAILRSK